MRQKIQLELAFETTATGEARSGVGEGSETATATSSTESPAASGPSMEAVVARDNVRKALAKVRANKGAPGVDGMTVDELAVFLKAHWLIIKTQLLDGTYRPKPVRRVSIPKPGGGVRALGIPTVLDRFIQQAMMQVLQDDWDPTFSGASYGFRPGRSAHQAIAKAQEHIAAGYGWVVDIDLEKFFDRVNHDILMGLMAKRVADRRLLRLTRRYLTAGVLADGLVGPTEEGTPQGGPLSPLLSNLMLDVLDRELEARGHRFCRYADDCNIYVRSRRAGERGMACISAFLARRLKLQVNTAKSAVDQPSRRKFLGFSFFMHRQEPRRRIAPQALARFKERVRKLTRRTTGVSLEQRVTNLASYLRGWCGYFGFCQTPSTLRHLEAWTRRRLRAIAWKQWKNGQRRYRELQRLGADTKEAFLAVRRARSSGPWRLSQHSALHHALPNSYFTALGLPPMIPKTA